MDDGSEQNPKDGVQPHLRPGQSRPGRTGPRTPAGKSRSRRNSLRHGIFPDFLADDDMFPESRRLYRRLLAILCGAMKPANGLERIFVEKLALGLVRLTRMYRLDAEVAMLLMNKVRAELAEGHSPIVTHAILPGTEVAFISAERAPALLMRYAAAIEREIDRTLRQIALVRRINMDPREA